MGTRGDVARQRWRDLLPVAHLLTGDPGAARGLVVATLAHRRGGADHDVLVDRLVHLHRRRRWAGQGSLRGEDGAPWWASPEDVAEARDLAARLDRLDTDERTAVVLRWYEDRSPDQLAQLVPGTDLEALARQLPTDLPRRLQTLAGLCAADTWDDDQVADSVRSATGRRARRAVLAVGVVAALAAGAVWLPGLLPTPGASPQETTATWTAPAGLGALPPQGALLQDEELVRALVAEARYALGGDGALRALVGQDVAGVRVVLLQDLRSRDLVWLTGRAGANPQDLDVSAFGFGTVDDIAAAVGVRGADGDLRLVLMSSGVREATALTGVAVDPTTGGTSRPAVELDTRAGLTVQTLDRTTAAGLRVLVTTADGVVTDVPVVAAGPADGVPLNGGPGPTSRSGLSNTSEYAYQSALGVVVAATGVAPDDLDVTVLGAGAVPTVTGGTQEVVSLGAVLPNGAVVTTTGTGFTRQDRSGYTSSWTQCGSSAYPAGTAPDDLVVAATCLVSGSASFGHVTVVSAPRGAEVVLDTGAGDPTVTPTLVDGFGWTTEVRRQDFLTATVLDGAVYPVAGPGNDALRW